MKQTILLLFAALLITHPDFGQGSKAQMGTQQEINADSGQQSATSMPPRTQLHSTNRSASWSVKKKNPASPNTLSEYATVHHSAAINQFFKQRMIVPAPSTAALLTQTPQVHIAVNPAGNTELVQTGEKLFSNDETSISSIYPNPASGYAFIDYNLTSNVREAKVVLYNVLGSPVSEYILNRDDKKIRISTFDLESGFYYYTLFVDGKSLVTRRLVVKH